MTTYCAPCLADLALVREAVTSVSGTAACVAHAVLLTHPHDTPQRRLTRLSDLRSMAEAKLPTASAEDVPAIELLVQEYALAGAMDMTVPLRDLAGDRTPRPPKARRDRGRGRDREGRPAGERGPRPDAGTPEAPASEDAAPSGPTPDAPVVSDDAGASAPESIGRASEDSPPIPAAAADAATSAPESSERSEESAPVGE